MWSFSPWTVNGCQCCPADGSIAQFWWHPSIHLWRAVFHYPVCKADSVFVSDFWEETKSVRRSVGQSSWRWRGWSPHWGQIIMPRNVAVDGQIIMVLRFLFHSVAKGTVFWNTVNKDILNAVLDNTPKPSCCHVPLWQKKKLHLKSCISY